MYQIPTELSAMLDTQQRLLITTDNGTELEPYTLTYTASCCSGDSISIGSVCSAMVRCRVFGRQELQDVPITVKVGAEVGGGVQYIPLGSFVVTESKAEEDSTTITAYDAAYYALGGTYTPTVSSGATVAAVLGDIANQCGLTLAPLPAAAFTTAVSGDLTGKTCRDMVGYLAALVGCNAVIGRDGKLRLIWFTQSGRSVTANDYYSGGLSLAGATTLAGVRMTKTVKATTTDANGITTQTDQTTVYDAGSGSGTVMAVDNPFATQAIVDAVWAAVGGLGTYRAGSCAMFGGMLTEPGDLISVTDLRGVTSVLPAMTVQLELDGGCKCTVSAVGQSDTVVAANVQGPTGKALSKLEADIGKFQELYAENLTATLAKISNLYADSAWVEKLFAQNLTATNLHITGDSTFDGTLSGATGTFEGAVTSKSEDGKSYVKLEDGKIKGGLFQGYRTTSDGTITSVPIYTYYYLYGRGFSVVLNSPGLIVDSDCYVEGRVYTGEKSAWNDGIPGGILNDNGRLFLCSDNDTTPGIQFFRHKATSPTSAIYETADGLLSVQGNFAVSGTLTIDGFTVPKMQKGSASVGNVTSTHTEFSGTFPKAFSSAPNVQLTPLHNSNGTLQVKLKSVSATGFTADVWCSSTTGITAKIYWLATY